MKRIHCIAIDDEPLALTILTEYVSKVPHLEMTATFTSAGEASLYIQAEKPDILFLDIQMPEIKGTDFIRTLIYKPVIILTTAYSEYALESFNLDAVDYLLKPIPFERFLQAINKAIRLLEPETKKPEPAAKDFIFVKSGYKSIKINLEDIHYFEGSREYVSVFTRDRKYMQLDTLKNLEEQLPAASFIRVHKSYIVNLSHVHSFYGNTLEVDGKEIPVGRAYKENVQKLIDR